MQLTAFQPRLGVLLGRVNWENTKQPFGSTTPFAKELLLAMRKVGGKTYFFSPFDYTSSTQTIRAMTYKENGWHETTIDSVHVIYNRLMSRRLDQHPSTTLFLSELKKRANTHIFNSKYLNKNDVFHALSKVASIQRFLPHTVSHTSLRHFQEMVKKHAIVFIKPVRGSLGKGIMKITRTRENNYKLEHNQANKTVVKTFQSLHSLHTTISPHLKRNKHQLQQGIAVLHCNGRPVDFRVLLHKNNKGKWKLTSLVGRIAANNQIVTNVARGGKILGGLQLLKQMQVSRPVHTYQRLKEAAIAIAKATDQHIDGQFGEFGIDLALDNSANPYLLEVNSKPAKNKATKLAANRLRPSATNIVQYASYLARSTVAP